MVAVALAVSWAAGYAIVVVAHAWGIPLQGVGTEGHGPPLYHFPAAFTLMVVYSVLVGPTAEVLFRGYGIGTLIARGLNRWLAGGIVAVLFVLMHVPIFGLGTTLTIIPFAVVVTVLRIASGNLTPGVMFHVINNFLAFLVVPML